MIARSDDYVAYCRETAKHARDPHDLALRGRENKGVTELVHQQIANTVGLHAGDDLVDIGCGDGTMLRIADSLGVKNAIGLLATNEEVAVLRRFGLNVRQALTDRLPLPDASASVIVCNSVLLVVPREQIPRSLREIHRVAKPGARIFVGEIPGAPQHDPTPQFTTRRELLSHLYRKHGVRTWIGMARRLAYRQLTGKPPLTNSGTAISFWASPEEFTAMAQGAGLELVRHWQCWQYTTRNNFLFRKAGEQPQENGI
jgi:ubiquinone/menaquinone biosynthesis C-methylase UbiE